MGAIIVLLVGLSLSLEARALAITQNRPLVVT
jgi:hypothetical protein